MIEGPGARPRLRHVRRTVYKLLALRLAEQAAGLSVSTDIQKPVVGQVAASFARGGEEDITEATITLRGILDVVRGLSMLHHNELSEFCDPSMRSGHERFGNARLVQPSQTPAASSSMSATRETSQ